MNFGDRSTNAIHSSDARFRNPTTGYIEQFNPGSKIDRS